MVHNAVAIILRNFILQALNFLVMKLGNIATFHAHQMVVVLALVQLVNRLACFKMMAQQNACLFKLREHTVNRRHAHFNAFVQQNAVYIFRAQMLIGVRFKQIQNFQTRASNL